MDYINRTYGWIRKFLNRLWTIEYEFILIWPAITVHLRKILRSPLKQCAADIIFWNWIFWKILKIFWIRSFVWEVLSENSRWHWAVGTYCRRNQSTTTEQIVQLCSIQQKIHLWRNFTRSSVFTTKNSIGIPVSVASWMWYHSCIAVVFRVLKGKWFGDGSGIMLTHWSRHRSKHWSTRRSGHWSWIWCWRPRTTNCLIDRAVAIVEFNVWIGCITPWSRIWRICNSTKIVIQIVSLRI